MGEPFEEAAVLSLLERIEDVGREASGVFLLRDGDRDRGMLVVDQGRLCWGACAGVRGELLVGLRGLLSEFDSTAPLSTVLRETKTSREGLLERLLREGVSEERLERLLAAHLGRCVRALAREPGEWRWTSHPGDGFGSKFSFSGPTILVSARLQEAGLDGAVSADLGGFVDQDMCALAFRWGEWFVPVASAGRECPSLVFLAEWGTWVKRVVEAHAATSGNAGIGVTCGEAGEHVLFWVADGVVFVVLCADSRALGRAYTKRQQSLRARTGATRTRPGA